MSPITRSFGSGRTAAATLVTCLVLVVPFPAQAQEEADEDSLWPLSNMVLTGYAYAGYGARFATDFEHDFDVHFAPIFLFDFGSDLLFATELEFELHGDGASFEMEYAQMSYLGFERLILTAGKFLLPFGHFGERFHPAWINRMPSMPLLYAHAHGGVAPDYALLPVLSDVGAMARYTMPFGTRWQADLSGWVSQGPTLADHGEADAAHSPTGTSGGPALVAAAGRGLPGAQVDPFRTRIAYHEVDDEHDDEAPFDIPTVAHGVNFSSESSNRQLGGGIALLRPPAFEVYLSGFHAKYDPDDSLDLIGANLAAEWRRGELEVRGEGVVVWQEFLDHGDPVYLRSPGYYVQGARRVGSWEPVVRWSHLPDATVNGETARHGGQQLALGLNYWLQPSIPFKTAYEWNRHGDDRLLLQWVFAF